MLSKLIGKKPNQTHLHHWTKQFPLVKVRYMFKMDYIKDDVNHSSILFTCFGFLPQPTPFRPYISHSLSHTHIYMYTYIELGACKH